MSDRERDSTSGASGASGALSATAPGSSGARAVLREPLFWFALVLAATRFVRLGEWSLWEDEVFTLADARAMIEGGGSGGPRNPLGYVLFAGLIRGLGEVPGEFGMRFVPALLGVLGIAGTGLCLARGFGPRRAAAAAAIVAASTWHLYWSQNARFYTLAQDLALIGGALALGARLEPQAPRRLARILAALVALVLAALAQPASALFLAGLAFACLALPARRLSPPPPRIELPRAAWVAGAVLAIALCAWAARVWLDYYRTKHDSTALHLVATSGWYFTPALLAAALFGAWLGFRARRAPDVLVLLACAATAALALANAFVLRAAAQYLFVLLPFVAVLATAPLVEPRAGRGFRALWLVVLLAPALFDQRLYFAERNGDRPPWREAFGRVHGELAPGDLVFTNNANVGEYYFAPRSRTLRHPAHVHNLDRYSFVGEQHWARRARRAWFVINVDRLDEWPARAKNEFLAMLESNARLVERFPVDVGVRDLDVLVYLRE